MDFGISKIIEIADKWLERIINERRDIKTKSMANVIHSAGLLVWMYKTLDNVYIKVVEENQIYNPSMTWERREKIQKLTSSFTYRTNIVDSITTYKNKLKGDIERIDLSDEMKKNLDDLVKLGGDIRTKAGFKEYSFLSPEQVSLLVEKIQNNEPYTKSERNRFTNLLSDYGTRVDTVKVHNMSAILGDLISEAQSMYPDIPYPSWIQNISSIYEETIKNSLWRKK